MQGSLAENLTHRPHLERYQKAMDSSLDDKIARVLPYLEPYIDKSPVILSVGAGTGKLEKTITEVVPNSRVICLDASLPMLMSIHATSTAEQKGEKEQNGTNMDQMRLIEAEAQDMPLQDESADIVIASSIVHEIGSYKDNHVFGNNVEMFYQQACRVLKKGGRLIVRDFVQPKDPTEQIAIQIGGKQSDQDMDPIEFLERFVDAFKGDDLTYIKEQIARLKQDGQWLEGAIIHTNAAHAFEVASHYSWARSFDQEVQEKYAYLPLDSYAKFIIDQFKKIGSNAKVVAATSYLQPGYPEHILGRLNFLKENGEEYSLPDFTGVIVIEKI